VNIWSRFRQRSQHLPSAFQRLVSAFYVDVLWLDTVALLFYPLFAPPPATFPDLAEAKARRIAAGRGCRCPFEAGRRPRVESQATEEYLGGR
jgi:hypothetical protein